MKEYLATILSSSPTVQDPKSDKSKIGWLLALAVLARLLGAAADGAADRENLPHRFPRSKHCFR